MLPLVKPKEPQVPDFWRLQVEAIYRKRNPYKLHRVPELLEAYRGATQGRDDHYYAMVARYIILYYVLCAIRLYYIDMCFNVFEICRSAREVKKPSSTGKCAWYTTWIQDASTREEIGLKMAMSKRKSSSLN